MTRLYLDPDGAVDSIKNWFMQAVESKRLQNRAPGSQLVSNCRPADALIINGFTKVGTMLASLHQRVSQWTVPFL